MSERGRGSRGRSGKGSRGGRGRGRGAKSVSNVEMASSQLILQDEVDLHHGTMDTDEAGEIASHQQAFVDQSIADDYHQNFELPILTDELNIDECGIEANGIPVVVPKTNLMKAAAFSNTQRTFSTPLRDVTNEAAINVNNNNTPQINVQLNLVNNSTPQRTTSSQVTSNVVTKRKNSSPVHNYCSEVSIENIAYYRCNFCDMKYKKTGGTRNIMDHLRDCHLDRIGDDIDAKKRKI